MSRLLQLPVPTSGKTNKQKKKGKKERKKYE